MFCLQHQQRFEVVVDHDCMQEILIRLVQINPLIPHLLSDLTLYFMCSAPGKQG